MRLALAWGLLAIVWLSVSTGLAQVSGRIESVGFDSLYRPTCWTPLLVKLKLDSGTSGTFELRVSQRDENGDFVIYTTRVTLTGGVGEQPFWSYFIPQPVLHGLRVASIDELQDVLRVTVHDTSGKELAVLPVPKSLPRDVDPEYDISSPIPGRKLILFVGDNSAVATEEFRQDKLMGTSESFETAKVSIDRLPESVLGYDAVDAIVWLDGDPAKLRDGGSTRYDALREFVRRGGHLVVCTNRLWQTLGNFGDLMPVDVTDVQALTKLDALKAIALQNNRWKTPRDENGDVLRGVINTWTTATGPIATARAIPRSGVLIETPLRDPTLRTLDWGNDVRSPWLVRRGFGYGCVSFVAQDLGDVDPGALGRPRGWMHIWDAVHRDGQPDDRRPAPRPRRRFERRRRVRDQFKWSRPRACATWATPLLRFLDLAGRSATLVTVAVLVLHVGYWIGGRSGRVPAAEGEAARQQYSWFAFGALAVLATLAHAGAWCKPGAERCAADAGTCRSCEAARSTRRPSSSAGWACTCQRDGVQSADGRCRRRHTARRTLMPFPRSPEAGWTSDQSTDGEGAAHLHAGRLAAGSSKRRHRRDRARAVEDQRRVPPHAEAVHGPLGRRRAGAAVGRRARGRGQGLRRGPTRERDEPDAPQRLLRLPIGHRR